MFIHLIRLGVRALVAAVALVVILALPLPPLTPGLFVSVHVPLAITIFIIYIGKLLYDTFFYDRYKP